MDRLDQLTAAAIAAHDRLYEAETQYVSQVLASPQAVVLCSEGASVRLWNAGAEELFGWHPEEVQGKKMVEFLIPPRYRKAHDEGVKRGGMGVHPPLYLMREVAVSALCKDGREIRVGMIVAPAFPVAGQLSYLAFFRDLDREPLDIDVLLAERGRAER